MMVDYGLDEKLNHTRSIPSAYNFRINKFRVEKALTVVTLD